MRAASPSPTHWAGLFSGLPDEGSVGFHGLCRFFEEYEGKVLAALPWVAAEIAARDGFPALLRVIRGRGGTRLYVSCEFGSSAARELAISEATHRRLRQDANAAGCIELPSQWGVFLALRRVAIRAALEAGDSPRTVARAFGVTERSLRGSGSRPRPLRNASA